MSESGLPDPPVRRFRFPLSRQRFVELMVVVFGVLIALGLDNLVQEIRFRADAKELEKAFIGDLGNAVSLSLERQVATPCFVQKLRQFSERVDVATAALEPAAIDNFTGGMRYATRQIYRPPTRLWVTSSFDRAQGSEAFKRIPADRAALYAATFAQITGQREIANAEFLAVAGLAPLAYSQTDLNAEVRADALQQIGVLDRYQALAGIVSEQIIQSAFSLPEIGDDVRRPFEKRSDMDQFSSELKAMYGDCADLTVFNRLSK